MGTDRVGTVLSTLTIGNRNMLQTARAMRLYLCLSITIFSCHSLSNISSSSKTRSGKVFNILQITSFPNTECTSTSGECGTCLTASECSGQGGIVSGTCAQGFGSCCLLYVDTCGGTIAKNRTCTWTFEKCATNVCQIRLDYDEHSTAAPDSSGTCTNDKVSGDPVTGPNTPDHCGENAGQHIYLDAGAYTTDSAKLSKVLTGTSARTWKIKVSMIECGSLSLPPTGCLQYHTGITGTVRSFNFLAPTGAYEHLKSQFYQACVRREKRFCKIGWTQSSDTDSFKISRNTGLTTAIASYGSRVESGCAADAILIPQGSNGGSNYCGVNPAVTPFPSVDRFCGGTLNCWDNSLTPAEIVSEIVPFRLGVRLNPTEPGTSNNRGFCLNYRQI